MSDKPVYDPEILTSTLAAQWVSEEGPGITADMAMYDIIRGRTVVVPVMTEAEAREAYIRWARGAYEERQCVFDPQGVFLNPEVSARWGAYLAAMRHVGAIK